MKVRTVWYVLNYYLSAVEKTEGLRKEENTRKPYDILATLLDCTVVLGKKMI